MATWRFDFDADNGMLGHPCPSILDALDNGPGSWVFYDGPEGTWGPQDVSQILHEFACDTARVALQRAAEATGQPPDPRSINAIEVKERWLRGEVTDKELDIARAAAWAAYATRDANWAGYPEADDSWKLVFAHWASAYAARAAAYASGYCARATAWAVAGTVWSAAAERISVEAPETVRQRLNDDLESRIRAALGMAEGTGVDQSGPDWSSSTGR